jgi:hypothetical protein
MKDTRTITNTIFYDIETGVYDQFPKLKERLEYIANKMIKCAYTHNAELSEGEKRTLRENEYIN